LTIPVRIKSPGVDGFFTGLALATFILVVTLVVICQVQLVDFSICVSIENVRRPNSLGTQHLVARDGTAEGCAKKYIRGEVRAGGDAG